MLLSSAKMRKKEQLFQLPESAQWWRGRTAVKLYIKREARRVHDFIVRPEWKRKKSFARTQTHRVQSDEAALSHARFISLTRPNIMIYSTALPRCICGGVVVNEKVGPARQKFPLCVCHLRCISPHTPGSSLITYHLAASWRIKSSLFLLGAPWEFSNRRPRARSREDEIENICSLSSPLCGAEQLQGKRDMKRAETKLIPNGRITKAGMSFSLKHLFLFCAKGA